MSIKRPNKAIQRLQSLPKPVRDFIIHPLGRTIYRFKNGIIFRIRNKKGITETCISASLSRIQ